MGVIHHPRRVHRQGIGKGTLTNIDAKVRQESLAYLRKMSEVALEMNCRVVKQNDAVATSRFMRKVLFGK
jgi:hypothetical protein